MKIKTRKNLSKFFHTICLMCGLLAVAILVFLLISILTQGWKWLDLDFLTQFTSRRANNAGIKAAIVGTFCIMILTLVFCVPLGISSAIYLTEYVKPGRWKNFLELNIANLAGVPSMVYGLLGLAIFVRYLGFGTSILSGALTLSFLILPVVIITSMEAISNVPESYRLAAYGLGARKWQVIFKHILPSAVPGMVTGVILALARAIGEAAPLLIVGGVAYIAFLPENIWDEYTVLPVQIFNWASRPQKDFHGLAAAGIIVLLSMLLVINLTAIYIREKYSKNRNL